MTHTYKHSIYLLLAILLVGCGSSQDETRAFYDRVAQTIGAYNSENAAIILCNCAANESLSFKTRYAALDVLEKQTAIAVPYFIRVLSTIGQALSAIDLSGCWVSYSDSTIVESRDRASISLAGRRMAFTNVLPSSSYEKYSK